MFALYDVLTYMDMQEDVDVEMIASGVSGLPYEYAPLYVKEIMIATIKHYGEMVRALESRMNKWTFARLNRVEQAILLLSLSHYFFAQEKVDKKVVINVAVELSKAYLDAKDYKFVNAILDKILTDGLEPLSSAKAVEEEIAPEESQEKKPEETPLTAEEEAKPIQETKEVSGNAMDTTPIEETKEEPKAVPQEAIAPEKIEEEAKEEPSTPEEKPAEEVQAPAIEEEKKVAKKPAAKKKTATKEAKPVKKAAKAAKASTKKAKAEAEDKTVGNGD